VVKKGGFTCLLLKANNAYNPLQAAVIPAASVLNSLRLRYDEKSRIGGKSMGRGWKGRKCWAVIKVANNVGGTLCSILRKG
jgi:hypothetical protein